MVFSSITSDESPSIVRPFFWPIPQSSRLSPHSHWVRWGLLKFRHSDFTEVQPSLLKHIIPPEEDHGSPTPSTTYANTTLPLNGGPRIRADDSTHFSFSVTVALPFSWDAHCLNFVASLFPLRSVKLYCHAHLTIIGVQVSRSRDDVIPLGL